MTLTDAYRATESASSPIGLNNNLRIGVDLIVRTSSRWGRGCPRATVQVPNGTGALGSSGRVPRAGLHRVAGGHGGDSGRHRRGPGAARR